MDEEIIMVDVEELCDMALLVNEDPAAEQAETSVEAKTFFGSFSGGTGGMVKGDGSREGADRFFVKRLEEPAVDEVFDSLSSTGDDSGVVGVDGVVMISGISETFGCRNEADRAMVGLGSPRVLLVLAAVLLSCEYKGEELE